MCITESVDLCITESVGAIGVLRFQHVAVLGPFHLTHGCYALGRFRGQPSPFRLFLGCPLNFPRPCIVVSIDAHP